MADFISFFSYFDSKVKLQFTDSGVDSRKQKAFRVCRESLVSYRSSRNAQLFVLKGL